MSRVSSPFLPKLSGPRRTRCKFERRLPTIRGPNSFFSPCAPSAFRSSSPRFLIWALPLRSVVAGVPAPLFLLLRPASLTAGSRLTPLFALVIDRLSMVGPPPPPLLFFPLQSILFRLCTTSLVCSWLIGRRMRRPVSPSFCVLVALRTLFAPFSAVVSCDGFLSRLTPSLLAPSLFSLLCAAWFALYSSRIYWPRGSTPGA